MARGTRVLRRTPPGLSVAIAVVVGLLAIISATAILAGVLPRSQTAPASVPLPSVSSLKGSSEKAEAVTVTDCSALTGGAGWVAAGTAKNGTKKEAVFTITVFFLQGDQPVNFAQSRVTIPAHQTRPWAAPARFNAGTATLTCKVVAVN